MNSSALATQAVTVEDRLTTVEREQAQLYLEQTHIGLKGAIKGLSEAQWQFTPGPDRWSIAKIVEHVIFVLERVGGPLRGVLTQAPAPPADRDFKYVDAIVIYRFPGRLAKFQAPEFALPGNRFASSAKALHSLAESYSQLADFLEETPDLREHAVEAAPLKAITNGAYDLMDGYQWILAAAAHAERHTKQILEVRADTNFPEN